jgi:hypothetical protein
MQSRILLPVITPFITGDPLDARTQACMMAKKAGRDLWMARRNEFRETDALRLDDLSRLHDLPFQRKGNDYVFEEFVAHGLEQALGFVEGYDRAMAGLKVAKAANGVVADHFTPFPVEELRLRAEAGIPDDKRLDSTTTRTRRNPPRPVLKRRR